MRKFQYLAVGMLSSYDPYLDNLNKLNSKLSEGTCPGLLELGDQVCDVRFGGEDTLCLYEVIFL